MGQGCVAVVDPGEGSGGAAPPYFWTKLRPKGPKKYWGGGDRAFSPYFKVWIWHCVALVEEDKTEAGRVLGGLPPLFLDQTEAQRAKKKLGGRLGPPPLFQGLDLALCCFGGGRQSDRTFNAFYD